MRHNSLLAYVILSWRIYVTVRPSPSFPTRPVVCLCRLASSSFFNTLQFLSTQYSSHETILNLCTQKKSESPCRMASLIVVQILWLFLSRKVLSALTQKAEAKCISFPFHSRLHIKHNDNQTIHKAYSRLLRFACFFFSRLFESASQPASQPVDVSQKGILHT